LRVTTRDKAKRKTERRMTIITSEVENVIF